MGEVTGELRGWYKQRYDKKCIYWGFVFDDIKGRFRDGSTIRTSYVIREDDYGDHILVTTRNSTYKLMKDQSLEALRGINHEADHQKIPPWPDKG